MQYAITWHKFAIVTYGYYLGYNPIRNRIYKESIVRSRVSNRILRFVSRQLPYEIIFAEWSECFCAIAEIRSRATNDISTFYLYSYS